MFKYQRTKILMKLQSAVVWRLPKWIVYWCTIRSGAHATTGKHSNQVVSDLTLLDTLKRWESKNKD